jgi:hypothetical protein
MREQRGWDNTARGGVALRVYQESAMCLRTPRRTRMDHRRDACATFSRESVMWLGNLVRGQRAWFEYMKFDVELYLPLNSNGSQNRK